MIAMMSRHKNYTGVKETIYSNVQPNAINQPFEDSWNCAHKKMRWLGDGLWRWVYHINVVEAKVNHPPNHHVYGYYKQMSHQHMGGLWHYFTNLKLNFYRKYTETAAMALPESWPGPFAAFGWPWAAISEASGCSGPFPHSRSPTGKPPPWCEIRWTPWGDTL